MDSHLVWAGAAFKNGVFLFSNLRVRSENFLYAI
jgi:hypothetical protein